MANGERRLQHAHETFRTTLDEALTVHFAADADADARGGGAAGGAAAEAGGADGPYGADGAELQMGSASALLGALRQAFEMREGHLQQRIDKLQLRQLDLLDKQKREAAAARSRLGRGAGGDGGGGQRLSIGSLGNDPSAVPSPMAETAAEAIGSPSSVAGGGETRWCKSAA